MSTNQLVTLQGDGLAVTTSLLIAEKFGKNHKDVLKAINNMECSADFNGRNFAPAEKNPAIMLMAKTGTHA